MTIPNGIIYRVRADHERSRCLQRTPTPGGDAEAIPRSPGRLGGDVDNTADQMLRR